MRPMYQIPAGLEKDNKEMLAVASGNLGIVYQTRGDLDQVEAMYEKALALFESMGARPQVEQVRALIEVLRKGQ